MKSRRVIGIGETVLDIIIRNGKPEAAVPGGSTFNAMISLGRTLGHLTSPVPVTMITSIGDDAVSDIVTSFMLANNVSTEGVVRHQNSQSTVSLAMLDENNNARYEFFRDAHEHDFEAPQLSFSAGDVVLFGSFFAVNPKTGPVTRELVRRAREAGAIVYYDINFRKNHLADLPVLKGFIEENCAMSGIVRGSSEDIEAIYGTADAETVYREHISALCDTFICTKGALPAEVFTPAGRWEFPVVDVETVSTIGAGDNFNAGILYGLIVNGFAQSDVPCLDGDAWGRIVPVSMRFSAEVCSSLYNYVGEDFWKSLEAPKE